MSYRDEYYNRTPEQEHQIYKDRERSWNVLRFFVALPGLVAVGAIFDYWYRMLFIEPSVNSVSVQPVSTTQAVVHVDTSCLFIPAVFFALFLGAAMVRAIRQSNQEIKATKPSKRSHRENVVREPIDSPTVPCQKKSTPTQEPSTLADDYKREMDERKERQRERASLLAMARKQKREAQERVREAQSDRLIASARYSLRQDIEYREAAQKER